MRVVIVGASGNVGTSLLEALATEDAIESVLGLARRRPQAEFPKTEWAEVDIETGDLERHFRGADAVVHLAWRIQPSRDLPSLRRTNVDGSARIFRAIAAAGVPALVYASSVGVYSPGPKDRRVDESWPRDGVPTSFYARHKAEVERLLDRFEEEQPAVRVVRMRPALIFKREAASEVRRLFLGPFLPNPLARSVRVPAGFLRGAAALTWRLRLQPTPAGWVDLGLGVPLLDVGRADEELGWRPRRSADAALLELIEGIRTGAGVETPPLSPRSGRAGSFTRAGLRHRQS